MPGTKRENRVHGRHGAAVGIKGVNRKAYEMCKTYHRILLVLRVDQVKCWF